MGGTLKRELFDRYLPKRKIGYLAPLPVIDIAAHQCSQLLPRDIMLVTVPMGLQEFNPNDVERVLASLEEKLALLTDRGVDLVIQAGVPLPILMGLAYHDELIARIEKITEKPAISQVMAIVASATSLGMRNIALANKWTDQMNHTLGLFFRRAGIQIAGVNSRSMEPSQFITLNNEDSLALAYELGCGAFAQHPDADGLYIGGGQWFTLPLVELLEKEFGKPVITNESATIWHACHLIDYWKPMQGYGQLMQCE